MKGIVPEGFKLKRGNRKRTYHLRTDVRHGGANYKEWREARRISKPGWTDLFGINAYAQTTEIKPEQVAYQRAASDIEYAEQATPQLDHHIMMKSLLTIVKPASESFKNN